MSVVVVGFPFLLINTISILGAAAVTSAIAAKANMQISDFESFANEMKNDETKRLAFENAIQEVFKKEIETNFVDKDTLVKTLEEHGAVISKVSDFEVLCKLEQYSFNFYKQNDVEGTPYYLKVECPDFSNFDSTMNELGVEYCANAQEVSYNLIKSRLEEKHLTVDNEEIYDDDTIVLTVNLE